jgi:hypothetical protein
MIRTRFVATAVTVGAAVSLLAAGPAWAQHGGGGGGTPPPTEGPPATFCPEGTTPGATQPDGTVIFGVEANGAGCVVVQTAPHGFALLETIDAPGWVSVFRGSGGDASELNRVEIDYEQLTTGRKVEVRIEPGRTEVK